MSDQFQNQPYDYPPLNENETTWEGSATDRFVRLKYQPDVNYLPGASQEERAPFIPNYAENHARISKESENMTSAKVIFKGLQANVSMVQ